jgi:ribonuclease P protein component
LGNIKKHDTGQELKQWDKATFSQDEKLLKGHQFRLMKSSGNAKIGKLMVLSYAQAPDGIRRLGIIVSKKFDKKAVQRKRAGRLIREAYRLIKARVKKDIWIVIIARHHLHNKKAFEVQQEMLNLLEQENLLEIDKDDCSNSN